MWCRTDIQFEHSSSGMGVRKRDIDTFLESIEISDRPMRLLAVTDLRLMAGSNCQGILVAPSTSTPVSSFPTPLICAMSHPLCATGVSRSTYLHQELCLYSPARFRFSLSSCPRQRVDLIDKDDCRFLFPCHCKELLDESEHSVYRSKERPGWGSWELTVQIHPSTLIPSHCSTR